MRASALPLGMGAGTSLLLAGLSLACASERQGEPSSAGGEVVRIDELPARHRGVLEAYGEGGAAWEEMREVVRADPELLTFTVENLVIEMVRAHDSLTGGKPSRARRAFDRSRAELVRLVPASSEVLVQLFAVGDGVVSQLSGEVLIEIGDGVAVLAAPLLDGPDPQTRRRAAVLLGRLTLAGPREEGVSGRLAQLALADPEWFVRAEAALALGLRAGRSRDTGPALAALERALGDPDPTVAEYAARGLRGLEDPRAVPALADALARAVEQGEPGLLRESQTTLRSLTGEGRDLDPEAWRAWWRHRGLERTGRRE